MENKLYRWVKASERLPENRSFLPVRIDGKYDVSTFRDNEFAFDFSTDTYDKYNFHRIEWLEEVPVPHSETGEGKEGAAVLKLIKAWESLPEGNYSPKTIQEWLVKKMKPAIDKIRKIQTHGK